MDKIFPSSGVLFKKTIKAAQELTSGSDLAAAKAAKQQVLKHLEDYKNTVLAFCGISPEEDVVLAGGNKRAKTHSKDASLSKRKADASNVPASGELTKKKFVHPVAGRWVKKILQRNRQSWELSFPIRGYPPLRTLNRFVCFSMKTIKVST